MYLIRWINLAGMPTLDVPGAVLHYQLRGNGPLLLISQSGEGDADRTTDLVDHLVDAYAVLTYDRRGLSRSTLDSPATIAEHADDVHRLLAAVADGPVTMLGCSLGAVIGMHVVLRHPGHIGTLVAHEPIAPNLLSDARRERHHDELIAIQDLYLRDGLSNAIAVIARTLGIDPAHADTEPRLTSFPMDAGRIANFDYFIRHDLAAAVQDDLDFAELKNASARIVPAAGRTTPRTVFDYQCAEALAKLTGQELHEFPGGHNGNLSHPRAYAARLRAVI